MEGAEEGGAKDVVGKVELAGGGSGHLLIDPILTRFWSRVVRLCQRVKVSTSWLTERYAELRNGVPRIGISLALTPCMLSSRISRVAPCGPVESCVLELMMVVPRLLVLISGTTSWEFGIVILNPEEMVKVRLPA